MEEAQEIVHGGGWVVRRTVGKPTARFFGSVSVLWLIVSVCAVAPFIDEWPGRFAWWHWVCATLVAPQGVFVVLAIVFWIKERPVVTEEYAPNPDYDPNNLY